MSLTYILNTFIYPAIKLIAVIGIGFALASIAKSVIVKALSKSHFDISLIKFLSKSRIRGGNE